MLKRILMITTGGTIASQEGEYGLKPETTGQQMLDLIPELKNLCKIQCVDLLNLDSTNVQPEEWVLMAQVAFYDMENYDGIVITHGTDTMAYSAAALDTMLIHPSVPVVLTGSQLPMGESDSDATRNIRDAFLTACGAPTGVYLTFDGRVIHGSWATKIRTMGFDAFVSVNRPYAGKIIDGKLLMQETAKKEMDVSVTAEPAVDVRIDPKVAVFKLTPGFDPVLLEAVADLGYHGVILEAYGCGGITNYRRNLLPAIEKLIHKGIVVTATTQSIYDGCDLSQYEVGVRALKLGVIPAGDLTTEALVVRTMIALGRWSDKKDIETFLRGDMSPVDRSVPLKNFIE